MSTVDFAVAAAALSVAGQQVSENLLGPFFHAHLMRVAAIGVSIGLTFGARELGLLGLDGLTTVQTVVLGGFAGFGSSQVHALLAKVAPGNVSAPLGGILAKMAGKEG